MQSDSHCPFKSQSKKKGGILTPPGKNMPPNLNGSKAFHVCIWFIQSFSCCISTVPSDVPLSLTGFRNHQTESPAYILLLQTPTKRKDHPPGEESLSGIPPPLPLLSGDQNVPLSAERESDPFISSVLIYSQSC